MEQTLSLIKPDGIRKGVAGEIIKRFESAGIRIAALKMLRMPKETAEAFYAEHQGKPFFEELTVFMSSGPIVAMVLEGERDSEEPGHHGRHRLPQSGSRHHSS